MMSKDNSRRDYRPYMVAVPLLLPEYPQHSQLCHEAKRIVDIIIMRMIAQGESDE